MKFLTQKEYHFKKPVITMGNFDGIHIGHQKLLHLLKRRADEIGGESIVVTYYHHPFETLHKKPYPYLLTEKDKKEDLLLQMGIDHVLFLKFDDEIADMSAQTFLENILIGLLHPVEIFVGYDTHFGRNRCGDFKYLKNNEEKYGYITHHIPPVKCSGQIISSTMIRKCISDGMVETAKQYLGRFYSIEGKIVHGEGIGRTIGFPTINLQPNDAHKLIPRDGIYFTFLNDANGNQYYGLTNIGYSPTMKTGHVQEIETYILDYEGNLYDEKIELFFIKRIRDEVEFTSKEELQQAIAKDVEFARNYICQNGGMIQ
ncbi:MAG TPA: bifunctional riboflavin kinase/FAD synthetase [Candidatus Cloacimonadota bacterium]|nr:bifunctional riboflavin kinase/FAD synthetase [Candidatus Cloacimonadota bacterium]HPT72764.1 bifunctional riboflavin kinase/FAD synthetase [Candidatus Cloacimonadota bacterium]